MYNLKRLVAMVMSYFKHAAKPFFPDFIKDKLPRKNSKKAEWTVYHFCHDLRWERPSVSYLTRPTIVLAILMAALILSMDYTDNFKLAIAISLSIVSAFEAVLPRCKPHSWDSKGLMYYKSTFIILGAANILAWLLVARSVPNHSLNKILATGASLNALAYYMRRLFPILTTNKGHSSHYYDKI